MGPDEAFGKALRRARKRVGHTQESLAGDAHVERNYISLLELGRNSPSVRMLYRICGFLDMTPSALLAQTDLLMGECTKKAPDPHK